MGRVGEVGVRHPSVSLTSSAADAAALDADLMSPAGGFSIDQLMELAGLAVAQATFDALPPTTAPRALVLAGPGNNGGDGLAAARHMAHFGYRVGVVCPGPAGGAQRKPLYQGLLAQLAALDVPFLDGEALPASLAGDWDVVVDALFGFSARLPLRAPYDGLLARMLPPSSPPPIVAVDVPTGWHVDAGDVGGAGMRPAVLVSLTAPKVGEGERRRLRAAQDTRDTRVRRGRQPPTREGAGRVFFFSLVRPRPTPRAPRPPSPARTTSAAASCRPRWRPSTHWPCRGTRGRHRSRASPPIA